MRKIINSTYISLDGVVDQMDKWPSVGDRGAKGEALQEELLRSCDTMIMGRRTYDVFAPVWSAQSGDLFSDTFNAMPKYVVSSTLTDPEWNNTSVISGDVAGEIRRLKEASGKDIVQYGFGQLSATLVEHDLLDELRLWLYPFFVGSAAAHEHLLFRAGPTVTFDLTDATPLDNGIVVLSYRKA